MPDIYKCFICGNDLTEENCSDEHILLNSLGGHIHSKKLICKNCNSTLGSTSDDELAKELNFFASFLDVPRQRGKNQSIKTLDEKYDLMPGGIPVLRNPIVKKTKSENGFRYEAQVKDESDLEWILTGIAKKHPGIDVRKAFQSKQVKNEPMNQITIPAFFSARAIFPSIIKSAVEYYLLCGGDLHYVQQLMQAIKGEENPFDYCMYCYPREELFRESIGSIYHILYVKGNATDSLLYGYVSYFDVLRCIVLLNDNYDGPDLEQGYSYEVLTRQKEVIKPLYNLTREQVDEIMRTSFADNLPRLEMGIGKYLRNADYIQTREKSMPEFNAFYDEQCERLRKGEINAVQMKKACAKKYSDLIMPWLVKYIPKDPHEDL